MTLYIVGSIVVFVFSGVMAMAGLGAAFLFVPLFYYLGVPFAQATQAALLLNVVSLLFATVNYVRGGLVNWRVGVPALVTAVVLAPFGVRLTSIADHRLLLWLFSGFLLFAGSMMLFYHSKSIGRTIRPAVQVSAGAGVGSVAGFLGGLLGVGGGNFVVPVLTWMGLDPKLAGGTTAFVVIFASLSGFLAHVTLGQLNPIFLGIAATMAAAGSLLGSQLMKNHLSSKRLKQIIGVLLWLIAAKVIIDLLEGK